MNTFPDSDLSYPISADEFRRLILRRVVDIARLLKRKVESLNVSFLARNSVPLIQFQTLESLMHAAETELDELESPQNVDSKAFLDSDDVHPTWRSYGEIRNEIAGPFDMVLRLVVSTDHRGASGLLLMDGFLKILDFERRFCETLDKAESEYCDLIASDKAVFFTIRNFNPFNVTPTTSSMGDRIWHEKLLATSFIASASKVLQLIRAEGRRPSLKESAVVQAAYEALGNGIPVSVPYRSLGVPGFKPTQTLLFLTDPGEGHLNVTCNRGELLESGGAAIHIEHIDRDESKGNKDTQIIEAYRLPSPLNVAKVRLHIGPDAPCTAFIGRPVFENRAPKTTLTIEELHAQYLLDRLKSAHMTASCCTAMFLNGVAECKVAIERMISSDAVDFIKAIVGNVFRDRHRQFSSAAFNIFTPLFDDISDPQKPQLVTDPESLCRLGISLAVKGGFNKVTWDGAKPNQFPSLPILARTEEPILNHRFWVETVHAAHLEGLTTYVSAGLEPPHMPQAVFCALDGVGIGVKLHVYDRDSGRTGEFDPEVMKAVLTTAKRAQNTRLGKAAKILARLARQSFEGTLNPHENELRERLLNCLAIRVQIPTSISAQAGQQAIEAHTNDLLLYGDESEAATEAEELLNEIKGSPTFQLKDDQPLDQPNVAQHRRLYEVNRLRKYHAKTSGRESHYDPSDLEQRMALLRSEMNYADLRDLSDPVH